MNYLEIHEQALTLAKSYQVSEIKLVEILQVVNRERVYKKMGYTSLFSYAVEALGLPPDRVYQFNVVAKKCEEVPELKSAIVDGTLNVSLARRIVSVIKPETSSNWISMAVILPQRQLEKEIAKVYPKEAVREKSKVLNATEAVVTCSITIEAQEQLERLKDLLSQKNKRPATLRDVLEYLAPLGIERLDPLARAERAKARDARKRSPSDPIRRRAQGSRDPIPAATMHRVQLRDGGQCIQVTQGKRCQSRRWLEVHHIKPVSMGGTNEASNLQTLCSSHHTMQHSA